MPIKTYRPTTSSRRRLITIDYRELSKVKPCKKLLHGFSEKAGRNNQGKISVRHRGAGNKRRIRQVDMVQNKYDIPGKIESVQYDPFRSSFIALAAYRDGERRYIAIPEGIKVGATIMSSQNKIDLLPGNRMPLKHIPTGTIISYLELKAGEGAKVARSAGNQAVIASKEGNWVHVKLPSGEIRLFDKDAAATIGQASNLDHANIIYGKAGRKRWKRIRPTVKGKNMNPVDHPHGGGEGHSPIGLKHPKTPWGKPALGKITRQSRKKSNRLIVRQRKGRKLKK